MTEPVNDPCWHQLIVAMAAYGEVQPDPTARDRFRTMIRVDYAATAALDFFKPDPVTDPPQALRLDGPCTYCGAPGHHHRAGNYFPPNGHTIRPDGTLDCPRALGDRHADAARTERTAGQPARAWDKHGREL